MRGSDRIHREFSVERLLINMRDTRLFLKDEEFLNQETRIKLQNFPEIIIDLTKNDEDDEYFV